MKEDTSKGNGSRGARYEYSLSDNVTWVQPPCFFGRRGRSDGWARFQCTSSIVVVSSSIMSIDEIFFFAPREGEFVLSSKKENWSVSLPRTNVRNKEDSLFF